MVFGNMNTWGFGSTRHANSPRDGRGHTATQTANKHSAGQKRSWSGYFGAGGDDNNDAKRQRIDEEDAKPSLSSLESHGTHGYKRVIPKATRGPFEVDDSDEEESSPAASSSRAGFQVKLHLSSSRNDIPSAPAKETQREHSKKLREKAHQRKMEGPLQNTTIDLTIDDEEDQASRSVRHGSSVPQQKTSHRQAPIASRHTESYTHDRDRHLRDVQGDAKFPIDLSDDEVPSRHARERSRSPGLAHIFQPPTVSTIIPSSKPTAHTGLIAKPKEDLGSRETAIRPSKLPINPKAELSERIRQAEKEDEEQRKRNKARQNKALERKRSHEDEQKAMRVQLAQKERQKLEKERSDILRHQIDRERQEQRQQNLNDEVAKQLEEKKRREAEEAKRRAAAKTAEDRARLLKSANAPDEQIQQSTERVRKQKERNARNADGDGDDDIVIEAPRSSRPSFLDPLPQVAKERLHKKPRLTAAQNGLVRAQPAGFRQSKLDVGPMSLSSASGTQALANAKQSQDPAEAIPKVDDEVGRILPADAKIREWKTQGLSFEKMGPLYAEITGTKRGREWLRVRYLQVKSAIEHTAVTESLMNRLANGDEEAIGQVNTIVHGCDPPMSKKDIEKSKSNVMVRPPGQKQDNRKPLCPPSVPGRLAVGQIRDQDVMLLQWRNDKVQWAEVINRFFDHFEDEWTESQLRRRHKQVEEALRNAGVGPDLVRRASQKDRDAHLEINRMLHGRSFDTWGPELLGWTSEAPKVKLKAPIRPPAEQDNEPEEEQTARPTAPEPVMATPAPAPAPRPTTGGKSLNEDFARYMFGVAGRYHEELAEEADEESELEEDEEGARDYFVYYVYRRELTLERLENPDDIDSDEDWKLCGGELGSLRKANARAAKEIFSAEPGSWLLASQGQCEGMRRKLDENRCLRLHLHVPGHGDVDVVVQRMLKKGDAGQVADTEPVIKRAIWLVKQRITSTQAPVDEMFDERVKTIEETVVPSGICTHPTIANAVAADQFVKLTFKSDSPNLQQREADKKDQIAALIQDCEEAEDYFDLTSGDIRVWVEQDMLRGPRNL